MTAVRRRPSRRRSEIGRLRRIVSVGRLAGVALIVIAGWSYSWLSGAPEFALDPAQVTVTGRLWTPLSDVQAALGLAPQDRPNMFGLRTQAMTRALSDLPSVASADVRSVLPGALRVALVERQPILRVGNARAVFLVDRAGLVIEPVPTEDAALAAAGALPLVTDQRNAAADLKPGDRLDGVDLAAMLTLAALDPGQLASTSNELDLSIDDANGFVISAVPNGWRAVFGFYTVSLRPTSIIPAQVQCLRSLIAGGEADIDTVYLEPTADRCGTYLPRATPTPAPSG